MTHNRDLMAEARAALRGRWGPAIGISVLYMILFGLLTPLPIFGPVGLLILCGPLTLGFTGYFIRLNRGQGPRVGQIFDGFSRFGTALVAYLMVALLVFLWMILLVIPGIIAAFSYALTFFILADNPAMGALDAIRRSKELMRGRRGKLFCLYCRFIGWALLCVLTGGIGFLWLTPYMAASLAAFYQDVLRAAESPVAPPPAGEPVSP
jgi:uncharacterized membrane protein